MNLMEAGKDSLYLAVSKAYDATGVVSGCLKCRLQPPLPNELQGIDANFPGCYAQALPAHACLVVTLT